MAKERQSAAFKAFLGGAAGVAGIQERNAREEQAKKAREQADNLAKLQRDAVMRNLKMQIEATTKNHQESMAQAERLNAAGLTHATQLQNDRMKFDLQRYNATLAATKAANDLLAKANLDYRTNASYDTARDTQLQFEKEGINGTIETDPTTGYSKFVAGTKDANSKQAAYSDLAGAQIPTATPYPNGFLMQMAGSAEDAVNISPIGGIVNLAKSIVQEFNPDGPNPTYTLRKKEEIQKADIAKADKYARLVEDVIKKDPNALGTVPIQTALNALSNVINRSEYSRKTITNMEGPTNIQNIKTRIDLMIQAQQQFAQQQK